jgi:ribosome-associated toxin RatA of RatAB toxin-antitoxin module
MILRLLCFAAVTAATALAPRWAQAQGETLDEGKIMVGTRAVPGSDTPEVVVRAVFNTPRERVWQLVTNCNDFTRTMPRIKASKELSREGDRVVCRVTVDMPFPVSDLTAVTEAVHSKTAEKWQRRWQLRSGDYKYNQGSWSLSPYKGSDTRTLVVYRALAVPKTWIPAWIRTRAQKSTMPEMIEKLRRLSGHR